MLIRYIRKFIREDEKGFFSDDRFMRSLYIEHCDLIKCFNFKLLFVFHFYSCVRRISNNWRVRHVSLASRGAKNNMSTCKQYVRIKYVLLLYAFNPL